jgi:hypothetical protein
MKKALLLLALVVVANAFSLTVPKKIMGQYDAEIPAFDFEDNGQVRHASAYSVSILLRENYMWYRCGSMKFRGDYTEIVENGPLLDIQVGISNESSIAFDLEIIIDRRTNSLVLKGLKGLDVVKLDKKQIIVEPKNSRHKRL